MNYFQGNKSHSSHLSVGAVLLNDRNEICVHHFSEKEAQEGRLNGYWTNEGVTEIYLLMRETLEPNEALEHALARGLREEFGAAAEIVDYIGSITSHVDHKGTDAQKTTLYFLTKLISQDLNLRSGDIESKTLLEWHPKEFLIPKMKEQFKRYGRSDIDESSILEKLS